MHNGRPHVQEHELDPPVSQLEIERLSTIFLGSLFGGEGAGSERNTIGSREPQPSKKI